MSITRPTRDLDPQTVRLAVSFTQPVYERLHVQTRQQERPLLAFTRPLPSKLMALLDRVGARPSSEFKSDCYDTIWELPPEWLSKPASEFNELDMTVAQILGVMDGQYPANAGYWVFGPAANSLDAKSSRFLNHARSAASQRQP